MDSPKEARPKIADASVVAPHPAHSHTVPAQELPQLPSMLESVPELAFDRKFELPNEFARIARRRKAALDAAPANTLKAWRHDWRLFTAFVTEASAPFRPDDIPPQVWAPIPAPPELVRAFIDYYSPASDDQLERRRRYDAVSPIASRTVSTFSSKFQLQGHSMSMATAKEILAETR